MSCFAKFLVSDHILTYTKELSVYSVKAVLYLSIPSNISICGREAIHGSPGFVVLSNSDRARSDEDRGFIIIISNSDCHLGSIKANL